MTTTPAMPEPFAWAWRNKVTGAKGVYFEDPKPFGITSHPDYEWKNLYTEAQVLAILALRPQAVSMTRASRDEIMAARTADGDADEWPEPWAYRRGWEDAEAHHRIGITAHAGGEVSAESILNQWMAECGVYMVEKMGHQWASQTKQADLLYLVEKAISCARPAPVETEPVGEPRQFPVLNGKTLFSVPWSMLVPHERQARANHGQSLERLADRGGLSPVEMVAVVLGKRWRDVEGMSAADAEASLSKIVTAQTHPAPGVPEDVLAILDECRNALMECDRDGDYALIDRIDALASAQAKGGCDEN